jgi:DNA-binding NarL/FixJ family response regulator
VRTVIIDDSEAMARSLADFIRTLPGVALAGVAASGPEGIETCERIKPDLVLLDFAMPGMNGLDVAKVLRRTVPNARVVVVSQYCRLLAGAGPWPGVEAVVDKLELGFELPGLLERLFPTE